MSEKKTFHVRELHASATASHLENLLNEQYDEGYELRTIHSHDDERDYVVFQSLESMYGPMEEELRTIEELQSAEASPPVFSLSGKTEADQVWNLTYHVFMQLRQVAKSARKELAVTLIQELRQQAEVAVLLPKLAEQVKLERTAHAKTCEPNCDADDTYQALLNAIYAQSN